MRQKRVVTYFGRALILAGALALAWPGRLFVESWWAQRTASRQLEQEIHRRTSAAPRTAVPRINVVVPPHPGDVLGRLDIPRIHVSVMVLEGADADVLKIAAGHIQGTALPGTIGNIGIAAHRDTFFRPLRGVQPNDTVTLTTPLGVYRYRVDSAEIVSPNYVQVLHPTKDAELTLVTCYPFYYIGSAPKRLIVHARRLV
jgi:sortase A